jgi:hypothetical protein
MRMPGGRWPSTKLSFGSAAAAHLGNRGGGSRKNVNLRCIGMSEGFSHG